MTMDPFMDSSRAAFYRGTVSQPIGIDGLAPHDDDIVDTKGTICSPIGEHVKSPQFPLYSPLSPHTSQFQTHTTQQPQLQSQSQSQSQHLHQPSHSLPHSHSSASSSFTSENIWGSPSSPSPLAPAHILGLFQPSDRGQDFHKLLSPTQAPSSPPHSSFYGGDANEYYDTEPSEHEEFLLGMGGMELDSQPPGINNQSSLRPPQMGGRLQSLSPSSSPYNAPHSPVFSPTHNGQSNYLPVLSMLHSDPGPGGLFPGFGSNGPRMPPPSTPTMQSMQVPHQGDSHGMSVASSAPPQSSISQHPFGEHPSRTLFVRNINSNVEDEELRALFETYGPIRSMYTQCKHRGFVMISYYDIRHAKNAMRHLQTKVLRRRKLDIHYSIPKDNPSDKDVNQGTLVVFNLDPSITNEELMDTFGAFGEIKEIRETPNKKHHKFIEFYDVRDAEKAMKHLNKTEIKSKKIKIEPSRPGGARKGMQHPGFGSPQDLIDDELIHSPSPKSTLMPPLPLGSMHAPPSPTSYMMYGNQISPQSPQSPTSPNLSPNQSPRRHLLPHVVATPGGPVPPMVLHPTHGHRTRSTSSSALQQSHSQYYQRAAVGVRLNRKIPGPSASPPQQPIGPPPPSIAPVMNLTPLPPPSAPTSIVRPVAQPPSDEGVGAASWPVGGASAIFTHSEIGASRSSDLSGIGGIPFTSDSPIHSPIIPPLATDFSRSLVDNNSTSPSPPSSPPLSPLTTNSAVNALLISPRHHQGDGIGSPVKDHKNQYILDIERVRINLEIRTTLMIKNIPNKYTQKMLLAAVDEHHRGLYDFFYLPIDFKNKCNVGYAFINFIHPHSIISFYERYHHKKWDKFNSEKVCDLSFARIQGKSALIAHFQNSSLMCEDKKCRPIIFHSTGPQMGQLEPFPVGPNVRMRRNSKDKPTRKPKKGSMSDQMNPTSPDDSPPTSPFSLPSVGMVQPTALQLSHHLVDSNEYPPLS